MRMLLTSGGLQEPSILTALVDLVGKPLAEARIVVVLDAILPFPGDKTRMLQDLQSYRELGWAEFDVLSLLSGPSSVIATRLAAADVVLGYGGSNHWLAHAWRASGLAPVLGELLDQRVYVGVSAGSMIFSRLHAAAVEALDDRAEVEMLRLADVGPALPLFDWWCTPHLGAPTMRWTTDAWAARVAGRLGGPAWFLDDASALLVRDLGADPEVVSAGHWLRFDAAGALIASDGASSAR